MISGARPPYNVCNGQSVVVCDPGFLCMPAEHSSQIFSMKYNLGEGEDCGADAAKVGGGQDVHNLYQFSDYV